MISDDFSFPKIAKPIPQQFMFSPSLWRVSSLIYPDNAVDEELGDEREVEFQRKSFSTERDIEERMDMLWEYFNEELKRAASLGSNKGMKRWSGGRGKSSESSRESTEEQSVQGLKVREVGSGSTTGGPVCHRRVGSSGMVVMKVLRKFFLLHSLVRIKKQFKW